MAGKRITKDGDSPAPPNTAPVATGYPELLNDLKARIRNARVKAVLSVNRELIHLYWSMGATIVQRQQAQGWGKAIVERLSADLRLEFPELSGLSAANIWRMRAFYLAWTEEVLAQPAQEIGKKTILAQPMRERARRFSNSRLENFCHRLFQRFLGATTLSCHRTDVSAHRN